MDCLNELRAKAESLVSDEPTRRPTWAPRLFIAPELTMLLIEMGWLTGDENADARLWARFTDPRRGTVECEGFELRAGEEHSGKMIFYAQYFDKAAVIENLQQHLETVTDPNIRERLEYGLKVTGSKAGGWTFGPRYRVWNPERKSKLERIVELGRERVLEFAGAPDKQMREAGRFYGHCCICGKSLTDPISIELGIGPECRHKLHVTPSGALGPWIIGGSNAA